MGHAGAQPESSDCRHGALRRHPPSSRRRLVDPGEREAHDRREVARHGCTRLRHDLNCLDRREHVQQRASEKAVSHCMALEAHVYTLMTQASFYLFTSMRNIPSKISLSFKRET